MVFDSFFSGSEPIFAFPCCFGVEVLMPLKQWTEHTSGFEAGAFHPKLALRNRPMFWRPQRDLWLRSLWSSLALTIISYREQVLLAKCLWAYHASSSGFIETDGLTGLSHFHMCSAAIKWDAAFRGDDQIEILRPIKKTHTSCFRRFFPDI